MRGICSHMRLVRIVHLFAACLYASTLLFSSHLFAAANETKRTASPQAKAGEEVFKTRCLVCHNKQPGDTTPFGPPNLYVAFKGPTAMSTTAAANIIVHGKGTMPAWGGILSKSDINDVIAYLRTR